MGMNKVEFTDMILNRMMNHPYVMVVNQDLKIDLSLDYQLIEYLNVINTRKQGVMLGADYYISGYIEEVIETNDAGKQKQNFVGEIQVRNIRNNKSILAVKYDHNEKKKRRPRKKRKGES